MRLVIDGYNLIPAIAELRRVLHQDLEAGREGLIEMLQSYRRNSSGNPQITVVFDGKSHHDRGGRSPGGVEVLFSRHEIADALILRLLKEKYRGAVLVTSDRALGEAAAAAKPAGRMNSRKSTHKEKTTGISNKVNSVDMASPPSTAEPSPR